MNVRAVWFTALLMMLLAMARAQVNYCNSSLCPGGTRHIACRNNGKFLSACPRNAFMVNLSSFRQTIVRTHNQYRNAIAGGRYSRYKPAARMATMLWDNQLAYIASFNVKQCQMKHDKCRNTPRYKMSGQNLAYIYYNGNRNRLSNDTLLKRMMQAWFREYKYANMNLINRYPRSHSGPEIGHFTAMMRDSSYRVGCAASRWQRNRRHYILLACNYATTNIYGRPIYTSGRATSGCKTGRNPNFKNLCSTREVYSGP